jgi:hypothetical protein
MIAIMSEDVGFAPGIRTGNDYLQNLIRVLNASNMHSDIEGEPIAREVGGRPFYRLHTILHVRDRLVYEAIWTTIIRGHALGFILAAGSPEDREFLEKTLTTLRFGE